MDLHLCMFLTCLVVLIVSNSVHSGDASRKKKSTRPKHYNNSQLEKIASYSSLSAFKEELDPLLKVRVSGTKANEDVRKRIIDQLRALGWEVTTDSFTSYTPKGMVDFTNIIATHNPSAKKQLVLACHHDSKWFKDVTFVGATDSAVPCAMLINIAQSMNKTLWKKFEEQKTPDIGLQFIFFDGEEAFYEWSAEDSLYGSRHLAKKLHETKNPNNTGESLLENIHTLVLLDLIGAKQPLASFRNWFEETNYLFEILSNIERRLDSKQLLNHITHSYFSQEKIQSYPEGIQDDHIPFRELNVPILHLISFPFPSVWHTTDDNYKAIDFESVHDLIKIMMVFIGEILHLKL